MGDLQLRHGDGSFFLDEARGYWTGDVEFPRHEDGRRHRERVRSKDRGKALAKFEALQRRAIRARAEALPPRGTEVTFEQWTREWIHSIAQRKLRPKTMAGYRTLINRHILPSIGGYLLADLTARDIRRMLDRIIDGGLSSTTARLAHRITSIILKYAIRDDLIQRNVAELVDVPLIAKRELVALSAAQAGTLIRHSRVTGDPLASYWAAVVLTGARQGELLGLTWDRATDVLDFTWQMQRLSWQHGCGGKCWNKRGTDCPDRLVHSPANVRRRHITGGFWFTEPKSRAGARIIPLVEPLKSILDDHRTQTSDQPNPYGLVWHTPAGKPIDPRWHSRQWHRALADAGLPDARLHDGRHTAIDLLYEAGVPEVIISEIVGHVSIDMTRAYRSKSRVTALVDAMQRLGNSISTP